MCVVSLISDHYGDKWGPYIPNIPNPIPIPQVPEPVFPPAVFPNPAKPSISREEFEALRKDVLEMKELMKKAIEYDRRNNEPACAASEKIALIKKMAELVGVDMQDILKSLEEGAQAQPNQ